MDRKIILVVDDDEKTIRLVHSALDSHYRVLQAPNGAAALRIAEEQNVDLALISNGLPDIEGVELLARMGAEFSSLPIVLLADSASKELLISALRLGAKDFLEKPVSLSALVESVSRVLEATRQRCGLSQFIGESAILHPISLLKKTLSITRRLQHFGEFACASVKCLAIKRHGVLSDQAEESVHTLTFPRNRPKLGNESKGPKPSQRLADHAGDEHEPNVLLRVHSLGKFQVFVNDRLIEHWPCHKGRDLFAYLAVHHQRRTYRDVLMDTFWPESTPDSARNSLNVAIHGVRILLRQIDPSQEYILYEDECYFINPEIEMWLDIEEFTHYWRMAQGAEREKKSHDAITSYELAAALYQGDFMEENLYESWPAPKRENLKEIYLFILDRLGDCYALDGQPATAIELCERILEKDNCREDVYRRMMRCYYRLGQRDKAIKTYQKCVETLKSELEIKPTNSTLILYQEIRADHLREDSDSKKRIFSGK